jgi:predicted lipoprotein with Yx(FWY)xxD motif
MKTLLGFTALFGGALVVSACGSSTTPGGVAGASTTTATAAATATPTATPTASAAPSQAGATVGVASNKLGQILVDGNGFTLYLFEADTTTTSTCNSDCAANWPPLLTNGTPMAAGAATQPMLGTTMRSDGTTQVTYNGHPVYHFISDTNAGDTHGQGLTAFGAPWHVLSPAGNKIA